MGVFKFYNSRVFLIIGFVMVLSILVPSAHADDIKKAKRSDLMSQMHVTNAKNAISSFIIICKRLPSQKEGLKVLTGKMKVRGCPQWTKRKNKKFWLLTEHMKDGFGKAFRFRRTKTSYTLTYFGRDGKTGGAGLDFDIVMRPNSRDKARLAKARKLRRRSMASRKIASP